jgi:hypothetical protein
MLWGKEVNVSINIIVATAGICLIDLCYIFVIHTQQDATQRNKIHITYTGWSASPVHSHLQPYISVLYYTEPVIQPIHETQSMMPTPFHTICLRIKTRNFHLPVSCPAIGRVVPLNFQHFKLLNKPQYSNVRIFSDYTKNQPLHKIIYDTSSHTRQPIWRNRHSRFRKQVESIGLWKLPTIHIYNQWRGKPYQMMNQGAS